MTSQDRYTCPCCGYLSFAEPPGSYDICEICFWEDDLVQLRDHAFAGGANAASLREAQANFAAHGWCEPRVAAHVRAPLPTDPRDPEWRPLEPGSTDLDPVAGSTWTGDRVDIDRVYYWRRRRVSHPRGEAG